MLFLCAVPITQFEDCLLTFKMPHAMNEQQASVLSKAVSSHSQNYDGRRQRQVALTASRSGKGRPTKKAAGWPLKSVSTSRFRITLLLAVSWNKHEMGEKVEGGENSSTTVEVKKQSVTRKESWEQKMRHNSSEAVMRSILREHAVVKFVLMVTHGTKPENADFADWLRDGSVLME